MNVLLDAAGRRRSPGLIAGSALLVAAVPAQRRPRVESLGELAMGVSAGAATAPAGPIVGLAGYATLAVLATFAAGALGALLAATARRGVPATTVPATRLLS
jgi:hypothetical protein